MDSGVFSVSLAGRKNLKVSLEFYQKLGFTVLDGEGESSQIMKIDSAVTGSFQDILTGTY